MLAPLVAGVAGLAAVAGLTSGSSAQATVQAPTGTATIALPPGTTPDFIFPLVDGAHYSMANIEQFQRLMYRPLYMYGKNGKPVLNDGREPRAAARLQRRGTRRSRSP